MSRAVLDDADGYRADDPDAPWNRPIKPKAKKDTRRWCKGKVGRDHTPAIERTHSSYGSSDRPCWRPRGEAYSWSLGCYHHEVCTTCGKVLRWSIDYDECPQLGPLT